MGKSSTKAGRSRGRKLIRLLVLGGIGALAWRKVQESKAPTASPYVPRTDPTPAPAEPPQAVIPTSPVEPEAQEPAPDPEPEDLERFEDEAPPAPPEDSLSSFFEEVMDERAAKGSHRS